MRDKPTRNHTTPAIRSLQQILRKIGLQLTQKAISKTLARYIPVVGALGVAGYSYYDTSCVADTAIELFSQPVVLADHLIGTPK